MFRTRSQLPGPSLSARSFIVNHYSTYSEGSSDLDIILRGSIAAGHDALWISNHKVVIPPKKISLTGFQFTRGPPESSSKRSKPNVVEWNTSIDSSEDFFNLDDLEEFENTDLSFLVAGSTKRFRSEGFVEQPTSKRRRLEMASIRSVIPQPHILPSPSSAASKNSTTPAYSKSRPIAIAPHTLPLPDPLPFTRRSWIIPVRGNLPWPLATSAVVLSDSVDLPEPPDPTTHEEIAWTAAALTSLWSCLVLIRDKNTLGPLGLSFHVSQYFSSSSQQTELSGMGAQPFSMDSEPAPSTVSSSLRQVTVPLTMSDHIKIYHDAENSMQIRNILDAWAFQPMDGGSKIRLFKGARLVLLDERAKGILLS
ncbi:hypothetical protein C8R43DRAFT_618620 [Mycena crocata]|nr:hypothetical protein C8R43DRAFT_618620 [Mycena crocata]